MRVSFEREKRPGPQRPEKSIKLEPPIELKPTIPHFPPRWVWMVIFLVCILSLLVMLYVLGVRSITNGGFFILPMMGVSAYMMMRGGGMGEANKQTTPKINSEIAEYLRGLDAARDTVHKSQEQQANHIAWHHPDPHWLGSLAGTARMWERRLVQEGGGKDTNFGQVRIGIGASRVGFDILGPEDIPPPELREPVTAIALANFGNTQQLITGVARPLNLFGQPVHAFVGEDRATLSAMLRAAVVQAATFHGPDHLGIAAVVDRPQDWEWIKWLPHNGDRNYIDQSGHARMVYPDADTFLARHGEELSAAGDHNALQSADTGTRHLLVIVDHPDANVDAITGTGGHNGLAVLHAAPTPSTLAAKHNDRVYYLIDGNLMRYYTPIRDWESA